MSAQIITSVLQGSRISVTFSRCYKFTNTFIHPVIKSRGELADSRTHGERVELEQTDTKYGVVIITEKKIVPFTF